VLLPQMPAQIRLKKFQVSLMKPHRISLVVGRRGSGKSVLLRDLLYHMRDRFDYGIAMCPTMESSMMLRSCMPSGCVFDRFVQNKVEQLVSLAQDYALRGKEKSFLLVLDDCMYDKSIARQPTFRNIFYNGRHFRLSVLILMQYSVDLLPELRAQIDYVFACREPILTNKIKLHRMFFGVFGTFEDFCNVLDKCTRNFELLVLDNTASSNAIQDCVSWYKSALELPEFRLCAPVFYKLCERYARTPSSSQSSAEQEGNDPELRPSNGRRQAMTIVKESDGASE